MAQNGVELKWSACVMPRDTVGYGTPNTTTVEEPGERGVVRSSQELNRIKCPHRIM